MYEEQERFLIALEREFTDRLRRNSNYSLRSFSKSIGVSHAALSLLFNRKRAPSRRIMNRVCNELGDGFSHAFENRKELEFEEFEFIASWVHYAILGLVSLDGFQGDPHWIARKLKISAAEARTAFRELVGRGFIRSTDSGWEQSSDPISVKLDRTSQTARDFVRGFLRKAETSLDSDPLGERDMTTITFCMREQDLPVARERIKNFRRALATELESVGDADRVYNLSVQLFPLSAKEN